MAGYKIQDTGYRIQDKKTCIVHRALCIVHHANEKGIALVMTLVISAIVLAVMAGLIYMITVGTQISGIQKRYKTALEAGMGGAEIVYQLIALKADPVGRTAFINSLNTLGLNASVTTPNSCITSTTALLPDGRLCTALGNRTGLDAKLNLPTSCWSGCDSSLTITPGTASSYDIQLDLGTPATYRVYAKIVDTVWGNTAEGDAGLVKGGVVSSGVGTIPGQRMPYLYTIEIYAQDRDNPAERAKLSILYQY